MFARTIAGCALDAIIAQPHVPSLAPHFVYERQTGLVGPGAPGASAPRRDIRRNALDVEREHELKDAIVR